MSESNEKNLSDKCSAFASERDALKDELARNEKAFEDRGHAFQGAIQKSLASNARLREALKGALEGLIRHDEAPYQCESEQGAGGSMDARRIIEDALKENEA